jgi:hypothetical protein
MTFSIMTHSIKCVLLNDSQHYVTINSILLSVILLNGIYINYYIQPKNKMCSIGDSISLEISNLKLNIIDICNLITLAY